MKCARRSTGTEDRSAQSELVAAINADDLLTRVVWQTSALLIAPPIRLVFEGRTMTMSRPGPLRSPNPTSSIFHGRLAGYRPLRGARAGRSGQGVPKGCLHRGGRSQANPLCWRLFGDRDQPVRRRNCFIRAPHSSAILSWGRFLWGVEQMHDEIKEAQSCLEIAGRYADMAEQVHSAVLRDIYLETAARYALMGARFPAVPRRA